MVKLQSWYLLIKPTRLCVCVVQAKEALEVKLVEFSHDSSKLQMRLETARRDLKEVKQKESRIASQVEVLRRQARHKDEDMLRLQSLVQQV